jgi:urease accessory protein
VAVLLVGEPAAAHTGHGTGVVDGILHPLTGPDHLLAMLAVGVVAVLAAPRGRVWVAPAAFLGGMVVGGAAGIAGLPLPGAEPLIVVSVLLLGLAIAGAVQGAGDWLVAALVVAGLAHGHAHGAEAPTSVHPGAYVAGFLLVTASLHLVGVGIGTAVQHRRTVRVGIGAATVAAGALLLA